MAQMAPAPAGHLPSTPLTYNTNVSSPPSRRTAKGDTTPPRHTPLSVSVLFPRYRWLCAVRGLHISGLRSGESRNSTEGDGVRMTSSCLARCRSSTVCSRCPRCALTISKGIRGWSIRAVVGISALKLQSFSPTTCFPSFSGPSNICCYSRPDCKRSCQIPVSLGRPVQLRRTHHPCPVRCRGPRRALPLTISGELLRAHAGIEGTSGESRCYGYRTFSPTSSPTF